MALDFLKLADSSLEKDYNARPKKDRTPERRAQLVAGIDNVLKQLKAKDANPKRGWYSTRSGVARLSVRLGNKLLTIDGSDRWHVPAERAADFYTGVKAAVQKGELDAAINATLGGNSGKTGKRSAVARTPSATRSAAMKAAWERRKAAAKK